MKATNNIQPYSPTKKSIVFAYGVVLSVIVLISFVLSSIINPNFASKLNLKQIFETKSENSQTKITPTPNKINSQAEAKSDVQVNITVSPSVTPKPTSKSIPTVKPTFAPTCINYKITTGEFKSDKCYTQKDYSSLVSYLGDYNMVVFEYNSATSTMKFVCNGSEFFKDSCDDAKDRRDDAKDEIDSLKSKIKEIIKRGK